MYLPEASLGWLVGGLSILLRSDPHNQLIPERRKQHVNTGMVYWRNEDTDEFLGEKDFA